MAANGQFEIHKDMIFKLSHKRSPSEVKLRSFEWAIVTQLNGEKTVGQIGEILSLDPDETVEMFERLMAEKLLELVGVTADDSGVPQELFDDLQYEFTVYLGPVAPILLEDYLSELKATPDTLERRQLPVLVELMSLEISSEEKRFEFQKQILQKIKGLL